MNTQGTGVLHYASAVEIDKQGILIVGRSGSGKSALAIDLISRGATLIADDQTVVIPGSPPRLSPPASIAGIIEVRGVGLLRLPSRSDAPAALIVDLDREAEERLPARKTADLLGCKVHWIPGKNLPYLTATVIMAVRGQFLDPETEVNTARNED
ncbi:MAG: serine kinase [Pseudomonadota bacterium]